MGDATTEDLVILRHHFIAKRNKKEAERKKREESERNKSEERNKSDGRKNDSQVVELD